MTTKHENNSAVLTTSDYVGEDNPESGCGCPAPFCLKSEHFRAVCESSTCCTSWVGPIGFDIFERNRVRVMYFAAFFSFIAVILQLIPVIGLSENSSVLQNVPFAYGSEVIATTDGDVKIELFLGIKAVVFKLTRGDEEDLSVVEWEGLDCDGNDDADYCESCADLSAEWTSLAILSLLTSLPQLSTDFTRSTRKYDVNCQKAFGMATGMFGFLTTMSALLTFYNGCFTDVNSDSFVVPNPEGGSVVIDVEWSLSVGYGCLLAATLFKIVDVVCHTLVPTPKYVQEGKGTSGYGGNADSV